MAKNYDVVIVGAGTAGMYLGWQLGKRGFSVAIVEKDKREEVGNRLDVIHFETDRWKNAGLPEFIPGEPDCIEIREESTVITPDFTKIIKIRALQTIVRLTPFLNKMYKILEKEGVMLEFNCEFKNLLFEEGKINGISTVKNGEPIEFKSKLVVDASGTSAVVRTSLPETCGVETFKLGPNDVMYVLLQYIKWKNPQVPHPETDSGYNWWLLWFGPSYEKDGAILGVGQPGSYENTRLAREDFLSQIELPPYDITKKERGFTPYRRPPYSLVADGFFCIGDAAAITYPFSGHGVTANWVLGTIAVDIIDRELKKGGYLTRERLWDINTKYFRDQGAKFAGLFTQLSGILNFSKNEWNYFLKKGLIYKTEDKGKTPEPNKEYEEKMSIGELLVFLLKIVWGLTTRNLSYKNVKRLLRANGLAGKIQKHYEKFPENPDNFDSWVTNAEELWKQKSPAIKKLSNFSIEYHKST